MIFSSHSLFWLKRRNFEMKSQAMDQFSGDFIKALERTDLKAIQSVPRSDLHNHALLGSRFEKMLKWYGNPLPEPPLTFSGITGMNAYLRDVLRKVLLNRRGFEYGLTAAFEQAVEDGITVLEMSIDVWFVSLFDGDTTRMTGFIKTIADQFSAKVFFIPQLGFDREADIKQIFPGIMGLIETGYFRSIDLYGEELACGSETFKEIFLNARQAGMRLKAHAGEFGNAESVRETVETLDLDEVQHGISASRSEEVMKWLQERGTQLNVCPRSNLALGIVSDLKEHPIRILIDHGISVTINTDDLMIFGQSVSEEYLDIYRSGLLSAPELDHIRCTGLKEAML
jgi:hypothetical protein